MLDLELILAVECHHVIELVLVGLRLVVENHALLRELVVFCLQNVILHLLII